METRTYLNHHMHVVAQSCQGGVPVCISAVSYCARILFIMQYLLSVSCSDFGLELCRCQWAWLSLSILSPMMSNLYCLSRVFHTRHCSFISRLIYFKSSLLRKWSVGLLNFFRLGPLPNHRKSTVWSTYLNPPVKFMGGGIPSNNVK